MLCPASTCAAIWAASARGQGLAHGVDLLAQTWPKRPQVRPDVIGDVLAGICELRHGLDIQFVQQLVLQLQR